MTAMVFACMHSTAQLVRPVDSVAQPQHCKVRSSIACRPRTSHSFSLGKQSLTPSYSTGRSNAIGIGAATIGVFTSVMRQQCRRNRAFFSLRGVGSQSTQSTSRSMQRGRGARKGSAYRMAADTLSEPLPSGTGTLEDSRKSVHLIKVSCMACNQAGSPLQPWSYDIPEHPPEGQVDVEISHCGVCGSDVHQIEDAWGVASFPLVPGHEIVGHVVRCGPGVDNIKLGQRVGIGVQRSHCGACSSCKANMEQACLNSTKTYAGPGKDKGGFSKYIRYNAAWVFAVPENLKSELVAPLMCAGITTYSPLKRHCRTGMTVGIIGVGGLGHIAIQIAAAMGCTVVAISRSSTKAAETIGFGATTHIVSEDVGQMRDARGTIDVILNTASGVAALDDYLALLKPRGVMACVSLPEKNAANMSKLFMQSIVPKEKSIVGSYLGPRQEYAEMLDFCAEHRITPKVELLSLEEANEAVARVKVGKARYRMVLTM